MQKEWQSCVDNTVTSLCQARGIPTERIIRARWVLVWKKSSDPDITTKTFKARLVLVGWQDPDLGKVAGVKFREGSGHSNLTYSFVGNAGEKFRQGSGPSNFTHPFVGHAGVKFREGCCPS